MQDKYISIKTFGNSMLPFFADGDLVILKKTRYEKISVNSIITFRKKELFLTHRVIYKSTGLKKNYLITKGDNNQLHDGKIYPEQILGQVVSVKHNSRTINIEEIYFYQSTLYFQEIVKIKNLLSENKVDFVILKGLPLYLFYDRKAPRRIYVDCDILIDKNQLNEVKMLFSRHGYKQKIDPLSQLHQRLKDKEPEFQFTKRLYGLPISFDIHTEAVFLMTQLGSLDALYPKRLLDGFTKKILTEKKMITIQNQSFPILSENNLIIYLALHLFHHNFNGYYRYELLTSVLKKARNIDYETISRIIREYRFNNFIYPVFALADRYYHSESTFKLMNLINVDKMTMAYIKNKILKVDIFINEPRISSGVQRFKNIFVLSPLPEYKKLQVFLNPQVLYSIYFVLGRKIPIILNRYLRK